MILPLSATETAADVRAGRLKARDLVEDAFARIRSRDSALNSFTRVFQARALARAEAVDHVVAGGENPGALAGVLPERSARGHQ